MAVFAYELLRDNECGKETAINNVPAANGEHRLGLTCIINIRVELNEENRNRNVFLRGKLHNLSRQIRALVKICKMTDVRDISDRDNN